MAVVAQSAMSADGRGIVWKVLGIVLALGLVFAALIGGMMWLIFGSMRQAEPVQTALAQARAHTGLVAALGSPVEAGWLLSGAFHESNEDGDAELQVPISGPRGAATVYVAAVRRGGQWAYSTLDARLDDGSGFDLRRGLAPQQVTMQRPQIDTSGVDQLNR